MTFLPRVFIVAGLTTCIAVGSFAQCSATSPERGDTSLKEASAGGISSTKDGKDKSRTVILALTIDKLGHVKKTEPLLGPEPLRTTAIRVAKERKYKPKWGTPGSFQRINVAVHFAKLRTRVIDIQEVMFAGVPSCIPAPEMVRISPGVMQTRVIQRVDPIYPPEARVQHLEGPVVLCVRIDKNGNVMQAEKVSGPDMLVAAAAKAVKEWKYQPTLINSAPIAVETTVEMNFAP